MCLSILKVVTLTFLGFGCIFGTLGAKTNFKSEFTKVECKTQSPKLVPIFLCKIGLTKNNISGLSVEFNLSEDILNLTGVYNLAIEHGKKFYNYTTVEMDYCQAFNSIHSQYVTQMVAVGIRRVSNFPLDCPFKKNVLYYVRDFTIDQNKIPTYVPKLSFRSDATFVSNKRKIAYFTLFGRLNPK